ncbi:MAG: glycoside hydrolase [Bacteroidales bacterium]|nr:glycoside hydrolase [Bacteroidales bacterium]
MKRLLNILALAALLAVPAQLSAKDYLATDFGAKADGETLNTAILQAAIDYASANGGGRVILSGGDFVSGTIYLKSGVTLHIEKGARLLGSLNPWDYVRDPDAKWTAFVFSIAQKNIGITGEGEINCRGFLVATKGVDYAHLGLIDDPLRLDRLQEGKRPENIHFFKCENIIMKDITLRDPASWNQQYDKCRNILVDGLKVDAKSYWNNDGIDIVDCSDVIIRNCDFDAADDVYCFKSHSKDGVSENILVENCRGRSSANGIKFGTYTLGKFKHFRFRNMYIYDTYRSAITIATVDGASIEDVEIDGLKSIHTGNPIFIRTGSRRPGDNPYMKDIVIKNVYAEVPLDKPDAGYSYEGPVEDLPRNVCPSGIQGIPGMPIQNITLENIEIVYPGEADPNYAYRGSSKADLEAIPELEKSYPEFSNWKELPAWGFYIRHAEGVTLKNVKITVAGEDYRPAIVADDVNGMNFKGVQIIQNTADKKKKQIVTNNVKNYKNKK